MKLNSCSLRLNQKKTTSAPRRPKWTWITSFFNYPAEIRKHVRTTKAIESINVNLRQVIKTCDSFPTDDAIVTKLFYFLLSNISKE